MSPLTIHLDTPSPRKRHPCVIVGQPAGGGRYAAGCGPRRAVHDISPSTIQRGRVGPSGCPAACCPFRGWHAFRGCAGNSRSTVVPRGFQCARYSRFPRFLNRSFRGSGKRKSAARPRRGARRRVRTWRVFCPCSLERSVSSPAFRHPLLRFPRTQRPHPG